MERTEGDGTANNGMLCLAGIERHYDGAAETTDFKPLSKGLRDPFRGRAGQGSPAPPFVRVHRGNIRKFGRTLPNSASVQKGEATGGMTGHGVSYVTTGRSRAGGAYRLWPQAAFFSFNSAARRSVAVGSFPSKEKMIFGPPVHPRMSAGTL